MSRENDVFTVEEYPAEFGVVEQKTSYVSPGRDGSSFINKSKNVITTTENNQRQPASAASNQAGEKFIKSNDPLHHSKRMEALGALTGGIVHDFNNLLTAIIGNTQLALCKLKKGDPLWNRLMEIEKASNQAAVLTRQLLALSRRQHLECRTINLKDTIFGIIKLLQRILDEDIEVSVNCARDLAKVFADPIQIEQLLINLCINAREALPNGGVIFIEIKNVEVDENFCEQLQFEKFRLGKYVQVSITDKDAGMVEEINRQDSDRFFSVNDFAKSDEFGLLASYEIVERHGGHISVLCEKGKGTSVNVYLPVDEKNVEAEREIVQLSLYGGTETILVAEDEEQLRNLAKDVLSSIGYNVLLAKNGEEAVEIFNENSQRIDILLFDIVMPRMGGIAAYERLKFYGDKNVPVIFMTGYNPETLNNRFKSKNKPLSELGDAVIQKPFNVPQLRHKIREILDLQPKRRRREEKQRKLRRNL